MIILWPIAGEGKRFSKQGYEELKPFIPINKIPMIEYAIKSLGIPGHHYIIANKLNQKHKEILHEIKDKYKLNIEIIEINKTTRGQAETSSLALEILQVDMKDKLVITNCDQFTPWDYKKFLNFIDVTELSAAVTTYKHKKFKLNEKSAYSHVEIDNQNNAIRFKEKISISHHSLNGIYYWEKADYFYRSAQSLINEMNSNEEMFLSHTFNFMIKENHKIKIYPMSQEEFYSLGTPEDIKKNMNNLKL
tara:strand:+ start:2263 stop:3006 length:744 start_codon:yes stop_codon:yes gene_type:complete